VNGDYFARLRLCGELLVTLVGDQDVPVGDVFSRAKAAGFTAREILHSRGYAYLEVRQTNGVWCYYMDPGDDRP